MFAREDQTVLVGKVATTIRTFRATFCNLHGFLALATRTSDARYP